MIEDGAIVAARFVAERTGKPTFAGAGQDSVTMPGVRPSRPGSTIRFILDAARWGRSRSGGGSQARITWSWFSQTARTRWSRRGWRAAELKTSSSESITICLSTTNRAKPRLGKLCGNGPDLWLNLQKRYDLQRAEKELREKIKTIPTLEVA
jgi:hypothetical protein